MFYLILLKADVLVFIYLFISRFVHVEYIQVLEQKDIASPTRFNNLTQPYKPRNSICQEPIYIVYVIESAAYGVLLHDSGSQRANN